MSHAPSDLLRLTDRGLYCDAGDFHIDPWMPVDRALITHAHGDHARWGSRAYACAHESSLVLRTRIGPDAPITTYSWGESLNINGVGISFHPGGHILGSAQIRVEYRGETWVVSGSVITVALIAVGFFTVYGRRRARADDPSCTVDGSCVVPRNRSRDKVLLWIATLIALVLLTFPQWSGLLV